MIARLMALPLKSRDYIPDRSGTGRLSVILSLLNRVAAIADDASLAEAAALQQVFEEVCAFTGWPIGHLYACTDEVPARYVSHGVWRLDPGMDAEAIAEFRRLSEQTQFRMGQGLIGIIAETRQARAVEDVTVLTQFLRADAARRNGVRGFFGFPVLLGGDCVAVAEFYGRQAGLLDETSLEIMTYVSSQLARVFERARFEKRRKRLMGQFETNVQGAAGRLGAMSRDLTSSAGALTQRCDQSADACTKVARGISNIADAAGFLDGAMADLSEAERNTEDKVAIVTETVHRLAGDLRGAAKGLETSSRAAGDIGAITRDVSEIAAQVRMLGLNASIEAARAGELGSGFAIVATEIKSLAQQSEAASGVIAEQIAGLQKTVRASAAGMAQVAEKMDALVAIVQGMTEVLGSQKQAAQVIAGHVEESRGTMAAISSDVQVMDQAMAALSAMAQGLNDLAAGLDTTAGAVSASGTEFLKAMRA